MHLTWCVPGQIPWGASEKKVIFFILFIKDSSSKIGTLSELLLWMTAKRMSNCYYSSLLNQNGIPHDTKSLVHNKLSIWKNISKCYTAYSWYNMPCKNCINAITAEFGTPSGSWNNARVGVLLNLVYYCTIINSYHYLRAESFFAIKCCNLLFILSI